MLLVTELLKTEVETSLGNFHSDQDFLDDDVKDIVMTFQWYNSILNGSPNDHIKF